MKRILAILAVLTVSVSGNAWAQELDQVVVPLQGKWVPVAGDDRAYKIDAEFYKQVPKNAHLHGKLQTTITTDLVFRDLRLKAGRRTVSQTYEEFILVLEHATLGNDGKVLIEDGALAYGLVLWSKNYTEGSGEVSKLGLRIIYVQKRDGSLGRVHTKELVFVEKRPSRKLVWRNSVYAAFAGGSVGTMFGPWGVVAGVYYGLGWGRGHFGHDRDSYQPKAITLLEGQELNFKVEKVKK